MEDATTGCWACAESGLLELERLATTVQTWWSEILAFILTGITNAGSKATNRVTKTVARDAYGFRNPVNQRLRTRCATTRRCRATSTPAKFAGPRTRRPQRPQERRFCRAPNTERDRIQRPTMTSRTEKRLFPPGAGSSSRRPI
ncbi:transposase [Dactylosporangium sp. AC04546]|nr:transposase [Dactylosporangium sp. AC04546]WVK88743.1 transposase [Dactylosporangium sp. AC04546]